MRLEYRYVSEGEHGGKMVWDDGTVDFISTEHYHELEAQLKEVEE